MPIRVIINERSGLMESIFGKTQAPLASYLESRNEQIEAEEKIGLSIFRKVSSRHFAEAYGTETEMGDMEPVGEGGAYPVTSFQEGYRKTINNVTFKNSFAITREAMDDNILTSLGQKPDKLLRSYHRGRNRMFAAMIGNASKGSTSFDVKGWTFDTTCMDGGCVFSTSHAPKVSGSNQTNLYADAFSADALFAAINKMRNLKDDDGNTLAIVPDTIIIPTANAALVKAVLVAVGSMQVPGSGNNDINPMFGQMKVIQWPTLNDYVDLSGAATPWFLFDSKYNEEVDGCIYQDRVPLEVRSELDPNDNNVWKAYARYGMGFVDFRQIMALGVTGGSSL